MHLYIVVFLFWLQKMKTYFLAFTFLISTVYFSGHNVYVASLMSHRPSHPEKSFYDPHFFFIFLVFFGPDPTEWIGMDL